MVRQRERPEGLLEMDAYGHVNNARTFTGFESARIAYMARIRLVGASAGLPAAGSMLGQSGGRRAPAARSRTT
ncbi:hypothetical protein D7X74_29085 [Corallococcus sp. CA047B]|nr:hypothetical protein D7X74_29085 [Corallococcus sp. CA047B]